MEKEFDSNVEFLKKKACTHYLLPTSLHKTTRTAGCHFYTMINVGPIVLRHRISPVLPIYLIFIWF